MDHKIQTQQQRIKFWNFVYNAATETEDEKVTLRIRGTIEDDENAWFYEWFGIPCASPNAFRQELEKYAGKNLMVWIDSYGGSVFAGVGLYNALMEHKNTGAKVTTIADGKTMSAATLPFAAGDDRLVTPGGMLMYHNPLTGIQGYASDLRKVADYLDEVKDAIINIYQLGTGLSRDKIAALMDDETYMSANKAINEGLATGMLYSKKDGPVNDPDIVNFAFNRMSIRNAADDSIKKIIEMLKNEEFIKKINPSAEQDPGDTSEPDANIQKSQEVKAEMEIKNSEELKTQLPAIHNEVYNSGIASGRNEGIKAERERLKAFDALNGKVDPDFLAMAKYEEGATAENVLFKALQEGKLINSSYVAQVTADAASANQVPGAASDNMVPDEVTGILNKVTSVAKRTLGIKEGGNK